MSAAAAAAVCRFAVPGRITVALDARELFGPEVDEACGVAEPVVDLWEAGVLLPSREQVGRLAVLTGQLPGFFYELDPIPGGRTFVCSRRKEFRSVTERGELACPVCPSCSAVCWMRVESKDGPVLLDGPDLTYGQLVMAVLGRTGRGVNRRPVWGVRPVVRGEWVEPHLRRRGHGCSRAVVVTCSAPAGEGGAACGRLGSLFPEGPRCPRHAPVGVGIGRGDRSGHVVGVSPRGNRPTSG